jgi:hypothetical protein
MHDARNLRTLKNFVSTQSYAVSVNTETVTSPFCKKRNNTEAVSSSFVRFLLIYKPVLYEYYILKMWPWMLKLE